MKKKKTSSPKFSPSSQQTALTLSDADLEKITKAVTKAILDAEQQKVLSSNEPNKTSRSKLSAKDILSILFAPVRRLKVENGAISLVKMITSMACWLISKFGYFLSISLLVYAGSFVFKNPTLSAIMTFIFVFLIVAIIWIISRIFAAAGVEIENTNNDQLIFGLSAFLFTVISIAINLLKKGV